MLDYINSISLGSPSASLADLLGLAMCSFYLETPSVLHVASTVLPTNMMKGKTVLATLVFIRNESII